MPTFSFNLSRNIADWQVEQRLLRVLPACLNWRQYVAQSRRELNFVQPREDVPRSLLVQHVAATLATCGEYAQLATQQDFATT